MFGIIPEDVLSVPAFESQLRYSKIQIEQVVFVDEDDEVKWEHAREEVNHINEGLLVFFECWGEGPEEINCFQVWIQQHEFLVDRYA